MNNKTEIWKKASEVYAEISELSPKQALAHLYDIQNITPEVREAVITLINSGSQASQYFADEISPNFHVAINNNQHFKTGQVLDEYELLEELGHGGMSQVFKAKRTNTDQQTFVAIKVFAPRENSLELLNHFINEQKILSGLSHPHIVKMLHGGKTNDETAYLVMELIEDALPLDRYCHENNLSIRQKIKLITQCTDALAYSHANLIIHRDLKPDNILINNKNELKIVDFGIAKLINKDVSGQKTTLMALTPSYAAPEQINSQPITVKTDVFSLAVVALDLLIEKNPLPKDRLIKSCANDEEFLDDIFKSLSCDKDLKNILTKALDQNPNNRYSSMQSFADDLNNFLANRPVNATSQSFFYRIQKFSKRRAALFATLVSFMVFLFIGSLLGFQQYKQITIEAEKANQVKQFMLDSFAVVDPNYSKGLIISAEDILDSASEKLLKANDIDSEIMFELLQTIGIAYRKIGFSKKSSDYIKRSLEINPKDSKSTASLLESLYNAELFDEFNNRLDNLNINNLTSTSDQSKIYLLKGKMETSESNFVQAKQLLNKSIQLSIESKDLNSILLSQLAIADFYYQQSETNKSIEIINTALSSYEIVETNTTVMLLKSALGTYNYRLGKYEEVIKALSILEVQQREILGDNHPSLAMTLTQLADAHGAIGQLEIAKDKSQESYKIYSLRYGKNSTKAATVLNSLAILHYQNGDLSKSIELMYEVVEIFDSLRPLDYADTLEVKSNLASLLSFEERNQESVELAQEIYNIRLKKPGPNNSSTIYSQVILARSLSKVGELSRAIELAQSANVKAIKYLGIDHPTTADTYTVLGKIYKDNGDFYKAIDYFKILIDHKLHKPSSPKYPTILNDIATLYEKLNEKDKATDFYLQAIEVYNQIYSSKHLQTIRAQIRYATFLKNTHQTKKLEELLIKIKATVASEKIADKKILIEIQNL